jgi:hypothetical protein
MRNTDDTDIHGWRWAYMSRLQCSSQLTSFGKPWVSGRRIWDAFAAPSGIKCEQYVGQTLADVTGGKPIAV